MKIVFCGAVVAVGLLPATAAAQTEASSFDELARAVKPGQKVVVADVDGRKTKGKIADISPSSITLLVQDDGSQRAISFDREAVTTIRKTDSVWNGLLIGLGVGFAATEVWVYQLCGPRGNDDECAAIVGAVGWLSLVPGGAVAGALIDKFTGNKLLYQGLGDKSTLRVMPLVGPRRTGLAVAVSF